MASKIDIISNAAILLGEDPVSDLSDGSKAATSGDNLYARSKRHLLSVGKWKFAKRKTQLSQLVEEPENEFSYAFQLPADHLETIKVVPNTYFQQYGDQIFANVTPLEMDYLYDVDEHLFPAYFVTVFEYFMAMRMAIPVTGSRSMADKQSEELYGNAVKPGVWRQALAADAQGQTNNPIASSPFIDCR